MKAAILLELRRIATVAGLWLSMLGISLVLLLTGDTQMVQIGITVLGLVGALMFMQLFPLDPANRSYALMGILPLRRRTVVAARYLIIMLASAIIFVLVMAICLAKGLDVGLKLAVGAIVPAAFFLITAAPLACKGAKQWAMVVPLLVIAGLLPVFANLPAPVMAKAIAAWVQVPQLAVAIGCGCIIALLIGSYALAARWLEKRDL